MPSDRDARERPAPRLPNAPARMLQRWEQHRTTVAIGAGFVLLALTCAAAIVMAVRAAETQQWATHSVRVRERVITELSAMRRAETAQRSYLLVQDQFYLQEYESATTAIASLRNEIKTLTVDNTAQQRRIEQLQDAVEQRLRLCRRTLDLELAGDHAGALQLVRSGDGQPHMTHIVDMVREIRAEELRLDQERSTSAARSRIGLLGAIIASVLTATILGMFVWTMRTRDAIELRTANASLVHEIEEHQRTGAQLRQSQKMEALGSLTGGLAHDFNNMLAIIVGSLDLLRKRVDAAFAHRVLIDSALDGARRAAALTQRLLAFSRMQPLDPRTIAVNKTVAEMSSLLSRTLGETIHIETVLGAGVWNAHVDAPQLESAILNLALNARDAMPQGGKLTLETSNAYLDSAYAQRNEVAAGQYVLLAVTDTGAGMPAEILARAFDPFFTTKPVGSGTGLGLSQVHGFMKQSGGHISLYSEPGVGTTVKLYLPRSSQSIEPMVATPREAMRPVDDLSVLVVEDDPGVRIFAVEALRELGFKTFDAAGAAAALDLLQNEPQIAILLTDVVMPEMNGRKLSEAALLLRPALKVLYMTGYTRNAIVHNGVLDVGTRLLTKPFTVTQLGQELRRLLDV